MKISHSDTRLAELKAQLEGELRWDYSSRLQYATDASAYREIPHAVAIPKSKADLAKLVAFAKQYSIPLIPVPQELHWQDRLWGMELLLTYRATGEKLLS